MSEMQWALVTTRDANDTLRSEWRQVPVEPKPYTADPFGEKFRRARVEARVSFATIADVLKVSVVHVSNVERGVEAVPADQQHLWWKALLCCTGRDEMAPGC